MTLKATIIGGSLGTAAHMMALAVQKRPLSRMPWLHVGWFVAGAYFGNFLERKEETLLNEVNTIRSQTGLAPLTGSVFLPGITNDKNE